MDDKPRTELTGRQKELLRKARNAIEREPGTYDQTSYGEYTISCQTPSCVAGHMVGADFKLRERLGEWPTYDRRNPDTVAFRIQKTAMEGLGLAHRPVLFQASWPIA